MSAVIRMKRKASTEPVDGLVVALKKTKCDVVSNEVVFKFAATLSSETDSVKDHLQAVLGKDRSSSKWLDPKSAAVSQKNMQYLSEKLRKDYKAVHDKHRLDFLNNRRLIFSESVPFEEEEENAAGTFTEVRKCFQLYDIIEENEEVKKQSEEAENTITCNGEPLVREKSSDLVIDLYVSDVQIGDAFDTDNVSVRPCTITNDDIYSGESEDSSEGCDDDDDSNDENNWRNDYPEEEDTHSEKDSEEEFDPFECEARHRRRESTPQDSEDELGDYDECEAVRHAVNHFHIDDEEDEDERCEADQQNHWGRSRVLQPFDSDEERE